MTVRRCPKCGKVVTWKSGRYYPYCSGKCEKVSSAWRQISDGMIHQPQCPEDWDLDQQFAHHENQKPAGAKDVTLDLWYFEHEQHGDGAQHVERREPCFVFRSHCDVFP